MPSYYDYDDYHSIAEDADELYEEDQWNYEDAEAVDKNTWENYYHSIASELTEQ
jgi:hypothetical protein